VAPLSFDPGRALQYREPPDNPNSCPYRGFALTFACIWHKEERFCKIK
jgi:hypothetical protein